MGTAYKCDVTGKMADGEGLKRIEVDISPAVRLVITPHVKVAEKRFDQGTISPEVVARIEKALKAEFAWAANAKN